MVVTKAPNWARIFRQVGTPLAVVVLVALLAYLINIKNPPLRVLAIPDLVISLLGAALGILLGFRTNSAYDRWWEARKLWGRLVNNSRSLARQAISFPNGENAEKAALFTQNAVYAQITFVHALRCSLRSQEPWEALRPLLSDDLLERLRAQVNVPAALLQYLGELTAQAVSDGIINDWRLARLDNTLSELTEIQGGCERIKNTPLPRQYDFYPELFVKVYCFLLPLVLVNELQILTPPITFLIAGAFLVLNRIGKNLEDPFENTVYDTPMTALSRTIEINLRQALGETNLPAPIPVVNGILW